MIIRSFLYDSIASCLVQIEDVLALAFQDGEKLLLHAKDVRHFIHFFHFHFTLLRVTEFRHCMLN